jgi:hypothetical protein
MPERRMRIINKLPATGEENNVSNPIAGPVFWLLLLIGLLLLLTRPEEDRNNFRNPAKQNKKWISGSYN